MSSDKFQILNSNRNEFKEKLNYFYFDNRSDVEILLQIDSWQIKTIEKVNQTADQLRKQFVNLIKSKQDQIKNQFNVLSQQIDNLQENQIDFDENLFKLENQLNQLNIYLKEFCQSSTIKLIVNKSEDIQWNDFIHLEEQNLHQISNQSTSFKESQFAIVGTFPDLYCEGRSCSKCGKCRDWYFTGDQSTWQWIRNHKNWTQSDIQRWKTKNIFEHFQCRDGQTCNFDHGFGLPGLPPGPHLDHRLFGLHICLCEDNIITQQ